MDTHSTRTSRRVRLTASSILAAIVATAVLPAYADQHKNPLLSVNPMAMLAQASASAVLPQRTSILVMGVDNAAVSGKQKGRVRSDTTILCTLDPGTRKISVVSIPRDSRVAIPGHGFGKVNSAYSYGGPALAMQTIRNAFNVQVDHYVVVNTAAMKKVLEVIGPLEVDVERKMQYTDNSGKLRIDLKAGRQQLSPAQVEQYIRFRQTPEADIGRIGRQQKVLKIAFKKVSDPTFSLTRLPQLLSTAGQVIKTDLPFDKVSRLALFGLGLHESDMTMASLPGRPENIRRVSYWIVNKPQAKVLLSHAQI